MLSSNPDEVLVRLRALCLARPETTEKMSHGDPAYIGPAGWIAVSLADGIVDWGLVEARLLSSWRMAAPRRFCDA